MNVSSPTTDWAFRLDRNRTIAILYSPIGRPSMGILAGSISFSFAERGKHLLPASMTTEPTLDLRALEAEKEFFIGVDSDGCVFDSMELKHKECFCPAFINRYGLQGVGNAGRETWEFVNLYSRGRGLNRFLAAIKALKLLNERPEVVEQLGGELETAALEEWCAKETKLGGPALDAFLKANPDADSEGKLLERSLNWSNDVANAVELIVHDLPPMMEAVKALQKIKGQADCLVVSQTPTADLVREWAEHDIDQYVRGIAGQELGTKTEHIEQAAGGKYEAGKMLMVGDAPGDHQAATDNGALFFPIVPGQERASWTELGENGLDRFFAGTYAGEYQEKLLEDFYACLPEHPPWA